MTLRMCPKVLENIVNLEDLMSQLGEERCRELFRVLMAVS